MKWDGCESFGELDASAAAFGSAEWRRHADGCPACRRELQAEAEWRRAFSDAGMPGADPGFGVEVLRRLRQTRRGRGRWEALALRVGFFTYALLGTVTCLWSVARAVGVDASHLRWLMTGLAALGSPLVVVALNPTWWAPLLGVGREKLR